MLSELRHYPADHPYTDTPLTHGDGAAIVVAGVTTSQGTQENCVQGEGRQVSGVHMTGGLPMAEQPTRLGAQPARVQAQESRVP